MQKSVELTLDILGPFLLFLKLSLLASWGLVVVARVDLEGLSAVTAGPDLDPICPDPLLTATNCEVSPSVLVLILPHVEKVEVLVRCARTQLTTRYKTLQ